MTLWRMIRRMFGFKTEPPRDPAATVVRETSEARASETLQLLSQIRESAETRRLANARRHYEERLHGTRG